MRIPEEWLPVIRNFEDRGVQALLQAPENARGLLCIIAADLCERLDFSRMVCEPVSFTGRNLRRRETDLVLRLPYRQPSGREPTEVWIYLLFEHQSEPDLEIRYRFLRGMDGLWDRQRREFDSHDVPIAQRRYLPVVPVLMYTGDSAWDIEAPLTALMDVPSDIEALQPRFGMLSLDVKATPPHELEASGHPLAWLLRVLQEEDSPLERLRAVAQEAMQRIDTLQAVDPPAFEAAFIFLILLLYHRRARREADELVHGIAQVRPPAVREETVTMAKTYAQELLEEGEARGTVRDRQDMLILLLGEKFGPLAERVVQRVQSIQDLHRLEALVRRVLHADSLEAMGI